MLNKKFNKVLAVSLLATLGLVACNDEIQAKPTNYGDAKILSFTNNTDEIYNNMVQIIQDSYREGTLASDVKDQVLYQFSVSVFGRYNRVAKPYNLGADEITLKEAYADAVGTGAHDKAKAFIDSHKAYQILDAEGNRLEGKESAELRQLVSKYETIEDRIAVAMYNKISGGTYSDRNGFFEEKFLTSLKFGQSNVADYKNNSELYSDVVITPAVEDVDVFDNYLHRSNYQDVRCYDITKDDSACVSTDADGNVTLNDGVVSYIEDEIVPTIYRTLLVEQYLLDESYNTLGRSYARKVNVLKVPTNSNQPNAARFLTKQYVHDYISAGKVSDVLGSFKWVAEAYKGANLTAEQQQLLEDSKGFEKKTNSLGDYYDGTDYGDVMRDYEKIKGDVSVTDKGIESSFTGNYTYPIETGLMIKEREIQAKDYVTNGWYIKNGGLSSLPTDITTRLFNINVANIIDTTDTNSKYFAADRWNGSSYVVPENESSLVAKINGKLYLKVSSTESGADPMDDIIFRSDDAYYIVEIEEAVSASKLSLSSTTVYDNRDEELDNKQDIVNEVAKVIADNDSYESLSTAHWLEYAGILFRDDVVFNYFKSNFPDIYND